MTNLEGLDDEQLRERLLVAETIMKKLYVRNKELEEFHSQRLTSSQNTGVTVLDDATSKQSTTNTFDARTPNTNGDEVVIDMLDRVGVDSKGNSNMEGFVADFKKREEKLEEELRAKDE